MHHGHPPPDIPDSYTLYKIHYYSVIRVRSIVAITANTPITFIYKA